MASLKAGKLDEAEAAFRRGVIDGDAGVCYLRLSEQCLRELQEVAPQSAGGCQAQGHGLRVQGRPDCAVAAFARAAEAPFSFVGSG